MRKCYETHENTTCRQETNYEIGKYTPADSPDLNSVTEIVHMRRMKRKEKPNE